MSAVRDGFRPTRSIVIDEPGRDAAATIQNAAEEKSPGTGSVCPTPRCPPSIETVRPSTLTVKPNAASARSVWSRVWAGSVTEVVPSVWSPARMTALLTWALGTIVVTGDRLGSLEIAAHEVPGLIDELPAISALAAHGGQVTIHGAGELRVKESDRITTLVTGFRNLGIAAEEHGDGYTVRGTGSPKGGVAHAGGDHRMAMAFAIAALAAQGPSTVEGAEAVVISYPGFFETLQRLIA